MTATSTNPFDKLPAPSGRSETRTVVRNLAHDKNEVTVFHRVNGYVTTRRYIEPSKFHTPTGNNWRR